VFGADAGEKVMTGHLYWMMSALSQSLVDCQRLLHKWYWDGSTSDVLLPSQSLSLQLVSSRIYRSVSSLVTC